MVTHIGSRHSRVLPFRLLGGNGMSMYPLKINVYITSLEFFWVSKNGNYKIAVHAGKVYIVASPTTDTLCIIFVFKYSLSVKGYCCNTENFYTLSP